MVGGDIRLNGEAYRVVGVLPADFELPSRDIAVLVPFAFTPQQMSDQGRGNEFSQMIARLAPGATIEQLDAQMKVIVDRATSSGCRSAGVRDDAAASAASRCRCATSWSATRGRRSTSSRAASSSCC